MSAYLECRSVDFDYGLGEVLSSLNLKIDQGKIIAIIGSSGCGKTSLLRLLSGLASPTGGEVLLNGVSLDRIAPANRGVSLVQESWALYPHLTVFENCAFSSKLRQMTAPQIFSRVMEVLTTLQIDHLSKRLPNELSGGQKQRVAIARALSRPDLQLFLADEPFSNLDVPLRMQVRVALVKALRERGVTGLLVSHDQSDVMAIADQVAFMHNGRVQQIGTARELIESPNHISVAQFLGAIPMNLLSLTKFVRDECVRIPCQQGSGWIGFRPETASLCPPHEADLTGHLSMIEHAYPSDWGVVEVAGQTIRASTAVDQAKIGSTIGIKLNEKPLSFCAKTGALLSC